MIQSLEIKIAAPAGVKIYSAMGSVLHGALMQQLDYDYAALLHTQALRPYSQCVYYDKVRQATFWRLNALNKQAQNEILGAAFALSSKVYLEQKNLEIQLLSKEYSAETTYDALAEKFFANPLTGRIVKYNFLTPVGFKSEGNYVIFPQPAMLFNSLIRRWNAFADSNFLAAQDLAKDLSGEVYVKDYMLQMRQYSVDGARIPAFQGMYSLGMKGNIMSNRVIALLSEYANYCGVGIKTALGMGAVKSSLVEKL